MKERKRSLFEKSSAKTFDCFWTVVVEHACLAFGRRMTLRLSALRLVALESIR